MDFDSVTISVNGNRIFYEKEAISLKQNFCIWQDLDSVQVSVMPSYEMNNSAHVTLFQ